jgi:sulfoxide reductase catalytic subunit YedY
MQPQDVDISNLPLTPIDSMHSTGTAKLVDLVTWRLSVTGPAVRTPLALTYVELGRMPTVKKRIILICPGFFWDFLEWDGVPLTDLLLIAGVKEFSKVNFISVDGYQASYTKQEVVAHLILIAIQGNGVPLPRTQGFPARVVAEDQFGTRWVKYLKDIVVN